MKYLFFLVFFASPVLSMNSAHDYDENHGLLQIKFSPLFLQWARAEGIINLTLKLQRFDYGDAEFVNSDIIAIPIDLSNKREGKEIWPDGVLRWTENGEEVSLLTKVLNMNTFNAFNLDIVRTGSWIIPWDFDPKTNTISPLMRHQYYEAK
ncbi:MAG: hypothetical protein K2X98_03215 [Alphaproteobacteria bacterium]|nr:hypothetical protein [Alphaproteobacteria bacterium]